MVETRIATIKSTKIKLSDDQVTMQSIEVEFDIEGEIIIHRFFVSEDGPERTHIRRLMKDLNVKSVKKLKGKSVKLVIERQKSRILAFGTSEKDLYMLIFNADEFPACCIITEESMKDQIQRWEERYKKNP